MIFRLGGRNTGKTKALLDWLGEQKLSDKEKRVIVTHDQNEAARLHAEIRKRGWGVDDFQVVTVPQVLNGVLRGKRTRVSIDNLDLVLSRLIGAPVDQITATTDLDNIQHV